MTTAIWWQLKFKQQLSVRCTAREDSLQKTIGIKPTSVVRKGKKDKKDKKRQRKSTRTKDADNKKRGADNSRNVASPFALNCPRKKKRESRNASYSGGGDLHCLTYTDEQFQWITMLEKVGAVVEQSNITELLMDSGAASHVKPCRMTAGHSYEGGISESHRCTGNISGNAESEVPIG